MTRIMRLLIAGLAFATSMSAAQTIWQRPQTSGPGQSFGLCEAPGGDLWSTGPDGVFVSHDRGVSWESVPGDYGSAGGFQIVADSAGTLFVSTNIGLLRSTDNGAHWEVSLNEHSTSYVTVGPDSLLLAANMYLGIYRSTDHGKNWYLLPSSPSVTQQLIGPLVHSGGVFLGELYDGPVTRFCRSTDRGETWIPSKEAYPITCLMAGADNIFFSGAFDTLLVSTDSARTWQRPGRFLPYGGRTIRHAVCDRKGHLFVGGTPIDGTPGSWLGASTDSGKTWICTNLQEDYSDVLCILPLSDGTVLASTYYDIYASTNQGATWQSLSQGSIANRRINCFTSSVDGRDFFAGTDLGVYCSTDDGLHWMRTPLPDEVLTRGGGLYIRDLAMNREGRLYVRPMLTSVISTTDRGNSWKGQVEFDSVTTCMSLDTAQCLLRGNVFGMVERSTNDGLAWMPTGTFVGGSITGLFIDPNDTLYISTDWAGLFRTAGGQGADAPIGLTQKTIIDFVKHPNGTLIGLCYGEGVFRSTDRGTTWASANSGIPADFWPQKFAMTRGGEIIVSGWSGVLMSSDAGATWHTLGAGLPADSVVSVAVTASGRIIAGTRSGIFYSSTFLDVKGSASGGVPVSSVLYQNYPNPFNPTTTIQYAVSHRSHVTLTVYNTLGQAVATLVNNDVAAGYHEVQFDASGLSSGVYFYRLQAGDFNQTRRLCLIK